MLYCGMSYSPDLRKQALKFAATHGFAAAARTFHLSRTTIYQWRTKPVAGKPGPRHARTIDMAALAAHVAAHHDMYLSERARHFGVSINGIWVAMRRLDICKKNVAIHGKM